MSRHTWSIKNPFSGEKLVSVHDNQLIFCKKVRHHSILSLLHTHIVQNAVGERLSYKVPRFTVNAVVSYHWPTAWPMWGEHCNHTHQPQPPWPVSLFLTPSLSPSLPLFLSLYLPFSLSLYSLYAETHKGVLRERFRKDGTISCGKTGKEVLCLGNRCCV